MRYIYVFVFLCSLCQCRPSEPAQQETSNVQIEKQTIIKVPTENEQGRSLTHNEETVKQSTKDILQKIEEVNLNHGLLPRKINKYPIVYQKVDEEGRSENRGKQLPQFQFPSTPYENPIFNYLQNENKNQIRTSQTSSDDEIPAGYGIKRKVTHQQTIITPGLYPPAPEPFYNTMLPTQQPMQAGQYGFISPNYLGQIMHPTISDTNLKTNVNKTLNDTTLEELNQAKQNFLINNIKNIISNSQPGQEYSNVVNPYMPQYTSPQYNPYMPQYTSPQYNPYFATYQNTPIQNPYSSIRTNPYMNPYAMYGSPQSYFQQVPAMLPPQNPNQKFTDTYYANLQTMRDPETAKLLNAQQSSRQMDGPFSQYFPIIIRNPFQQMFQAFTSMIEYGPEADGCKNKLHQKTATNENNLLQRISKSMKEVSTTEKPHFELKDEDTNTEIVIQKLEETTQGVNDDDLYIEGLEIISNPSSKKEDKNREAQIDKNIKSKPGIRNMNMEAADVSLEEDKFFGGMKKPGKEETGSGIFIQRLKVRKGGVAIAGPGGIATAGSGGTAIVGPNGFAYTQPNGVAIAGPGSKVIAVDPSIDLSEYIMNITRRGASTPRIGKVVAVGPVVYHNLGQN